jgi:hypothetical protein
METTQLFVGFMGRTMKDSRITPWHISLYMALLRYSAEHGLSNPICVYSKDIMPWAKFSSVTTYHKHIRDLSEYGYLKYIPSYNPFLGSLIYFINVNVGS